MYANLRLLAVGLFAGVVAVYTVSCAMDEKRFALQQDQIRQRIQNTNMERLAGQGEVIGTLPDGRTVVRYWIETQGNSHALYVTGMESTLNRSVSNGKYQHNQVEANLESK